MRYSQINLNTKNENVNVSILMTKEIKLLLTVN